MNAPARVRTLDLQVPSPTHQPLSHHVPHLLTSERIYHDVDWFINVGIQDGAYRKPKGNSFAVNESRHKKILIKLAGE